MVAHEDWSALRAAETQRMLAACTRCGACFEACPMVPYARDARGTDAKAAVTGVLDVLSGGAGDAASRNWISVCTRSGSCNEACPEAVNPMLMLRLAKWQAQEGGVIPKRDAAETMSRVKVFARLSFTEKEQGEWL
ncbi:(Fe-S)-binding protein [Sediminicoccus rosea]|uniref:(Fe-S)-binding protein n=1 Tax=Sediminicoccus rosea TaxID=1225128 RepID=A0ABZ0PH86_9PROT|nr:(Fe-S)-binding protein [Sediminicoccus rosea]WPB84995.1 (Fe-S)-binding protein [Sediminicoccus rosea]